MKTETFKANDPRTIVAHRYVEGSAASLLNPFINDSAADTCKKVESIMAMLYSVLDKGQVSEDTIEGIKLIIQTVWTAMQYESSVANLEKEVSA